MPTGDQRHRAKRLDGGLELAAALFNAIAIVTIAAAFINPIANRHDDVLADGGWVLLVGTVGAHVTGQAILRFLKAED